MYEGNSRTVYSDLDSVGKKGSLSLRDIAELFDAPTELISWGDAKMYTEKLMKMGLIEHATGFSFSRDMTAFTLYDSSDYRITRKGKNLLEKRLEKWKASLERAQIQRVRTQTDSNVEVNSEEISILPSELTPDAFYHVSYLGGDYLIRKRSDGIVEVREVIK